MPCVAGEPAGRQRGGRRRCSSRRPASRPPSVTPVALTRTPQPRQRRQGPGQVAAIGRGAEQDVAGLARSRTSAAQGLGDHARPPAARRPLGRVDRDHRRHERRRARAAADRPARLPTTIPTARPGRPRPGVRPSVATSAPIRARWPSGDLADDPDLAGHQISRRSARKSTIWRGRDRGRLADDAGRRAGAAACARRPRLSWRRAPPTGSRIEPEVGQRPGHDLLRAGGHDPLQRRVARLAQRLRRHDEGRQRRLEHVVAGRAEAVHARPGRRPARSSPAYDRYGRPSSVAIPGGDDAAAAVRGVGAGQDQVVLEAAAARPPGRATVVSVSDPASAGIASRGRRAGRPSPGPCAASRGRPPGPSSAASPRLAGGLDQLEGGLEGVLVVGVDDRRDAGPVDAQVRRPVAPGRSYRAPA